jgi:hypothetical protein
VPELPMVSASDDQPPAIGFDQPNDVSDLHCHTDRWISSETMLTRGEAGSQPRHVPSTGIWLC